MPKTPAARSAARAATRVQEAIDFRANPERYRILRGEQGVFTTPPYSTDLKGLWRFKDEEAAQKSAAALLERFNKYREDADFIGMDITRKFVQMGRTRSLRYALRPGGRKYDKESGQEMKRTGEVADQSKLKGAQVFEGYLKTIEEDETYVMAKNAWRVDVEGKKPLAQGSKLEVKPEVKLERMASESLGMSPKRIKRRLQAEESTISDAEIKKEEET